MNTNGKRIALKRSNSLITEERLPIKIKKIDESQSLSNNGSIKIETSKVIKIIF